MAMVEIHSPVHGFQSHALNLRLDIFKRWERLDNVEPNPIRIASREDHFQWNEVVRMSFYSIVEQLGVNSIYKRFNGLTPSAWGMLIMGKTSNEIKAISDHCITFSCNKRNGSVTEPWRMDVLKEKYTMFTPEDSIKTLNRQGALAGRKQVREGTLANMQNSSVHPQLEHR